MKTVADAGRSATEDVAFLVVSCDRYQDLWRPYFLFFHRYYPLCPFKKYLLCNESSEAFEGVQTIKVGADVSWSDNLIAALHEIPEPYVLLLIEDLFLHRPVDAPQVEEVLNWAVRSKVNYLRLNPTPRPDRTHTQTIGIVSEGSLYRASVVVSLWKKSVLLSILQPGETAWEFEERGSFRSDSFGEFYASKRELFPVRNAVVKGKYRRFARGIVRGLATEHSVAGRAVMSYADELRFVLKLLRSALLRAVPWNYRRLVKAKVQDWGRRGGA